MSKTSLQINFAIPTSSDRDDLLIEQKEWGSTIGGITKMNFAKFVGGLIYGNNEEGDKFNSKASCGVDSEGNFNTTIYVYPYNPDMIYSIDATLGILDSVHNDKPRIENNAYKQEVIAFRMGKEASSKYPILKMDDIEAVGDLYDAKGNVIPLSQIFISLTNTKIKLSQKIYGSIGIRYYTRQHEYPLYVLKRDTEETLENFFSSVVYAWWNGGIKWLDVEAPPGAEERAKSTTECGYAADNTINTPKKPKRRPEAKNADRYLSYNYCTGENLNDSVIGK